MSPRRLLLAVAVAAAASTGCHALDFSPRFAPGEIGIYDDLFSVSVADADHVVAVGYQGAVYWSEDSGTTWQKGDTPSQRLLYSVSMADDRHGWAVGQLGTILRTDDGGKTWAAQDNLKIGEGVHLFGVHALDATTAWAVGEWGSRIVTRDGGKTWEDFSLTIDLGHPMFVWLSVTDQERVRAGKKVYEDVGLNDVFCRPKPSNLCWIIGEFGYIFHSEDRGVSWTRGEILGTTRMDPIELGYNEIEIPDSYRAQLERFASEIEDAQHLNVLIDPYVSAREIAKFVQPNNPEELFDIIEARIDETKAVLEEVGVMSDRMRMPAKPPWDYVDFQADDATFLDRYLAGRTTENPRIKVSVIQNPFLFTVFFRDDLDGFISGLGGVILRSADGGRSWMYRETDRKQALFSVKAVDGRAVAIGEKGLIRVSTDAGMEWREPSEAEFPPIFTFMRDLDFDLNERVGFIVGQEGMVLRSDNSGASWTQVLPPPNRRSL